MNTFIYTVYTNRTNYIDLKLKLSHSVVKVKNSVLCGIWIIVFDLSSYCPY